MKRFIIPDAVLNTDRIICRLLAAWCLYISTTLFVKDGLFKLDFNQGRSLLIPLLCIFVYFTALSFVAYLMRGYNTDSWFLFIGASFCVARWGVSAPSANKFFFSVALGIVYSLFLVWIFRENEALISKIRPGKKLVVFFGILFFLISCFILSAITCLRYKTFSSPNFDFGIFVNMFHNMKETGLPLVTCERDRLLSHFAVHISPVYYLLLPFYLLFPSPYTLQIGQAVVLMAGIVPVILLAKHYKLSGKVTVLFSALYVFYTALSTGCFYDIHENCFLTPLLLFVFLFFEKGKPIPMYLCVLLTLGVKEDAAVYLIFFALFVIFSKKKYIHGIIVAAISVSYFLLCSFIMEKYGLGMMVNRFDNLILNKDEGLLGAIKTVLLNPGYVLTQLTSTSNAGAGKLIYILQLMLPLGFLPFCTKKPSRWLLISPLLVNLLTMYVYQYDVGFQYSFGIIAFLFYAAIGNAAELSPALKKNAFTLAVAFSLCFYTVSVVSTFGSYAKSAAENGEKYARMEEILDTIPEDASVCASTFLLPHIADRDVIYEVAYHENTGDVDYVVLDARYGNYRADMLRYLEAGYEEILSEKGMIVILRHPDLKK